uniref:G-protein coupled receptors family 1 profile domain-containing protein n=1 Tax=Strongyloides stercoralis TaxID=6248 RepID=A0A0K0EL52_STRER
MGIQRMSVIFNKSTWFTQPNPMAIICLISIIFDIIIIILRRKVSFKRWINFKGLFFDSCKYNINDGILVNIANILVYSSFVTPIIVLILFFITYYRLKKAKVLIHNAEKNEAIAIENAKKQNNFREKSPIPINSLKNMKNIIMKYRIESEKTFLFQQMVLCITVSIGISTTYLQFLLIQYFEKYKLYFGIIRMFTYQISFSSLSICLIIFNKSIRDDIYELFIKILS